MAKAKLTEGSVFGTIIRLAFPMLFGMFSIVMYNLADTFFVGKLGKIELAAISFTFPVVSILASLAFGLGIGASSLVSTAIGSGDNSTVKRLTSDVLLLAVIIAVIFSIAGYFTIVPLFTLLGAKGKVLELVTQYMKIWYLGAGFVVIPMVGNNVIRATGDTKSPAIIMSVSGIVNVILDPLLIFGISIFPEMGIRGAALATVIARSTTCIVSLNILIFREKILCLKYKSLSVIIESWKKILYIGVPEAFTRIVMPLANGFITRMVAGYGTAAVAGFGVASRVEFFILLPIFAVGSVIAPFTGQNLGAGKLDRVKKAIHFSWIYSILCGISIYLFLFLFSDKIAAIFNPSQEVVDSASMYMRLVSPGYGFYGIVMVVAGVLNVFRRPLLASFMNLLQMIIIYLPLAYILSAYLGLKGIYLSRTFAFIVSSIVGIIFLTKVVNNAISIRDKEFNS